MISTDAVIDVHRRIRAARLSRCGGDEWVQPPANWAKIIRESWPLVWSQEPSRCPDGWVDLLMAFSEHAVELGGGGLYHDAFENVITGKLVIQRFYDDDRNGRLFETAHGYQTASVAICRVCGEAGDLRRIDHRPTRALCDDHFQGV